MPGCGGTISGCHVVWRSGDADVHDLTPGTPRIWRAKAVDRALIYLGDQRLIYGSDAYPADDGEELLTSIRRDQALFRQELGLTSAAIERIMAGNLLRMLDE